MTKLKNKKIFGLKKMKNNISVLIFVFIAGEILSGIEGKLLFCLMKVCFKVFSKIEK